MKNTRYFTFYVMLGLFLLLTACEEEEIMKYDVNRSAINFIGGSDEYTFLTNTEDEYVMEIDVRVLGDAADYDRTFSVAIIDTLTTAQPDQYEVVDGVVEAGAFEGKLYVKLFKSEMLNDTVLKIGFEIVDSNEFLAGNKENSTFVLEFTNKVIVPSWTYIKYFFCSTKSTECYRVFVTATGLTEFTRNDYIANGMAGSIALGTKFGDYIMEWNKNNPDNHLKHDDGDKAGEDIIPRYYTHSKYD